MMMNPVSSAELARIQADAAAILDLPCTVQRSNRTPEPEGGASVTWATVATCNAGMKEPTGGQLQNYGYLIGTKAAWQVKLPIGTDVLEQDHLLISGETLEVAKVLTPRSYAALITVLATEVK